VIVSSGLPQLIAPVLAREGLELEVRSNDADPDPAGWRLRFRDEGPCPVCGDMCKRRSLPEGRPLVYAGDGVSDRCAARAADRVFARGWLADELRRQGLPHERFESLDDVAAALS
jgi:2-hydroxy-3-keto-5-methylthiopentenyl-1-phosphate phosphatase